MDLAVRPDGRWIAPSKSYYFLPPPAMCDRKLVSLNATFGTNLSCGAYVSCDRTTKLLSREGGWHDCINTVSTPYQHNNYTVSTVYQQRINRIYNLMARLCGRPDGAVRRHCGSSEHAVVESRHAAANSLPGLNHGDSPDSRLVNDK